MKVTVLVLMVVFCSAQLAASQPSADCTARHGPGCLQCENVTITAPNSYPDHPRRDGGGGWGGWGGRRLLHGGQGGWGAPTDTPQTRLVCLECDTGYKLATRPNSTYGTCRCIAAAGWGTQPGNSSSSDASRRGWEHGRAGAQCIDCKAEDKVPLTDQADLHLLWDGSSWVLVLADSSASSSSVSAQHAHGGGGYGGWDRVPPPFRAGDCVACPANSAPSADYTSCVANNNAITSPDASPSPAPVASPTPDASPSPPSSAYGACLTVSAEDITTLESTISEVCAADGTDVVSLDTIGTWSDDPNQLSVWVATDPEVLTESGLASMDTGVVECSKIAALSQGTTVTVTWLVNDTDITCSPATGTFTFTVPAVGSSSNTEGVAGLVAVVPVEVLPLAAPAAPRAVAANPVVVATQPVLTAQAVAAAPVAAAVAAIPVTAGSGTVGPVAVAAVPEQMVAAQTAPAALVAAGGAQP